MIERIFVAMLTTLAVIQGAAMAERPADTPRRVAGADVGGSWRLTRVRLAVSTCPASLTDTVRDRIRRGMLHCDLVVSPSAAGAVVTQICPEETLVFAATIDADGLLYASERSEIDDYGCRWFFTNTLSARLAHAPAPIALTYRFQFEPSCKFPDCVMQLVGELERPSGAAVDPSSASSSPAPDVQGTLRLPASVFATLRTAAGPFR